MMNLSIITVSFGNAREVAKLLQSLKKYPPQANWELIVVDNNSPKTQNYDFLKSEKNTHLVSLHKNLGFGKGNEEGVKFSQGEILAFINPDIEVQKGTLDTLLETLKKNSSAGIVVPVLETHDGISLENTWNFPTFWGLLKRRITHTKKTIPAKKMNPVDWAQGSFLVMQKNFFESLGGFDHRFFLFFEDTDLCRQCWEHKKQVVQNPASRAFHTEHRLSGGHLLIAVFKKTFWIHLHSALKYFWKYRGNDKLRITNDE